VDRLRFNGRKAMAVESLVIALNPEEFDQWSLAGRTVRKRIVADCFRRSGADDAFIDGIRSGQRQFALKTAVESDLDFPDSAGFIPG